ncbi:MAG TPA: hypothetical protein EYO46_06800 [Candidatus Lambdaproteobacteria bacterium]|nr:hypothetical protein [Candidatus Lambdaproteobacteria bacterium]HIN47857.1 hypothetical protein [Deltaproteobacteria bacterium]HIA57337.1 hypothetical protein [Candidatus Lambdaproteobacteria bacterium]HIB45914.1 hypothetical protein [Candidatus Lambdaproteobacteria bacterium]HIB93418.1 hypothetical protein [Candidatus Lambdaproteobacteria bacterium]
MSRGIFMLLTTIIVGCSGTKTMREIPLSDSQYYVSCPPHVFYCYRKSELICHSGYRVLTVARWEDNPEMIIECQ